jgi:hypothetical protein
MKNVFIASPFRGDTEQNIIKAREYCRTAIDRGCMPFAPHLLFPQFLDDNDAKERGLGFYGSFTFIFLCDEFWSIGKPTPGMELELAVAKTKKVKIRYFNKEMEELNE